jgi:subtilisin family serine protease
MKVFVKRVRDVSEERGGGSRADDGSEVAIPSTAVQIVITEHVDLTRFLEQPQQYQLFDDIRFEPLDDFNKEWWNHAPPASPALWQDRTQGDVLERIKAPQAWSITRGRGVTIMIVDSGVDLSNGGFGDDRRSPLSWAPAFADGPWADAVGHGTMCAHVACAARAQGAAFDGVAPEATLLSARSTLEASDLYMIYDQLLNWRRTQVVGGARPIVVSNSYGMFACSTPRVDPEHPFRELVQECVRAGIVFVFGAGNNHCCSGELAAEADHPNTIWSVNSCDEVITVGAVDWDDSNQRADRQHRRSSRGPGEWSTRHDKPDVVAPTYGRVAWGASYRTTEWWGTSGACPQVAGLAALLLSKRPEATPLQIWSAIRQSAQPLVGPQSCVGSGLIDCAAALALIDSIG